MSIFYQWHSAEISYLDLTASQMLLKDFLPKPENRQLVRLYRIVHFIFDRGAPAKIKAYPPRPEHVLSFFPYEPEEVRYGDKQIKNARCVITGQHDQVFQRFCRNEFMCLQIVFQPSGLHLLTGIPCVELRNQYLHAEEIFSHPLQEVNEQLFHAKSYEQVINVAESFVGKLKPRKVPVQFDKVASLILEREGNASLDWLADQSSLSIKQFERNFKLRTGASPKTYMRITRFDKAFRMRNHMPDLDWLSIAIACGYYDYQHLAKDYLDFTSLTPPAFHMIENKAPERLFGLHEGFLRHTNRITHSCLFFTNRELLPTLCL
jgi:AraC-like DNA-binding protein